MRIYDLHGVVWRFNIQASGLMFSSSDIFDSVLDVFDKVSTFYMCGWIQTLLISICPSGYAILEIVSFVCDRFGVSGLLEVAFEDKVLLPRPRLTLAVSVKVCCVLSTGVPAVSNKQL